MDGQALYYGMNALSHNVIMADRKKLKSANGMYLGSTGSGKSFAAKRELLNVFLTIPQDRIIIVDPMGEYAPLVRRLGGQVIEIAPDSPHHLNPMDVELNMAAGESPLSMKADFLLSLCELEHGRRGEPSFHEGGFPAFPVRAGGRRKGRLTAHRKNSC